LLSGCESAPLVLLANKWASNVQTATVTTEAQTFFRAAVWGLGSARREIKSSFNKSENDILNLKIFKINTYNNTFNKY